MELESYRMDVLVALQTLTRLDKDIFADEEKEDASVMRKENKDDDVSFWFDVSIRNCTFPGIYCKFVSHFIFSSHIEI